MDENWNNQKQTSNGKELKIPIECYGPAPSDPLSTINCNKKNDCKGVNQENNIEPTMEKCTPFKVEKIANMKVDCSPTIVDYEGSYPKNKTVSKKRQMKMSNSENNSARKGAMEQLDAKRAKWSEMVVQECDSQKSEKLKKTDCKAKPTNISCNNRISTLEEINKLRISRFKLELIMYLPIFGETVRQCFVRISIGSHKSTAVYRIAEIVGVVELPNAYMLGIVRTRIGLRLRHGRQEMTFAIKYVSNQNFTKSEFSWWQDSCAAERVKMPYLQCIEKKLNDIKKALDYKTTKKNVECMTTKKKSPVKQKCIDPLLKTSVVKDPFDAIKLDDFPAIDKLNNEFQFKVPQLNDNLCKVSYLSGSHQMLKMEKSENIEFKFGFKSNEVHDPFTRRRTQPRLSVGEGCLTTVNDVPHTTKSSWSPIKNKNDTLKDQKQKNMEYVSLYDMHNFNIEI